MTALRISLFGGVRITHGGRPCEARPTRRVQAILGYLLLGGRKLYSREELADNFWELYSGRRARRCLSTALWRLRQALEPTGTPRGTYLLASTHDEVGFNWESDHRLDVAIFEDKVRRVLSRPMLDASATAVRELEDAVQLYSGDLLEGVYDDWALLERERLRCLYVDSLACLMHYAKHSGDYRRGLEFGRRILQHDLLREEIHREMMRLYVGCGQRAQAIRQYESCCEILERELQIPPMEETQALYAQIVSSADVFSVRQGGADAANAAQQALQHLRTATNDFDNARRALQRVMPLVERLADRRRRKDG